jgi:tripartite-type tricarboxylate transporter receptor subunit TctC
MLQSSGVWLAPFLTDNVRYDPVRDLASVTIADKSPSVIVVHPSLPVNSLKELIALAKARPGTLNWSSGNNGSTGHLAGELFKVMTGANIVRIPYKSGGQETADLVSGVVQMAFNPAGSVMTQVKAGKLRALAVANSKPSTLTPGVPTTAEAGLSGYEMEVTHAVFAPAGTPAAIINLVNQEMVRFLRLPDTREKLLVQGVEPVGSTPEEMSVFIKADMARLGKLIKDLGIRAD